MKKLIALFLCINFVGINASLALEDELVNSTLDKNLQIQTSKMPLYEDKTAALLDSTLQIKPINYKAIENNMLPQIQGEATCIAGSRDDKFDFENLGRIVVKVSPEKYLSTKHKPQEGEYVNFFVKEDVKLADTIIAKNTPVKARVETVSMNGAYGVPANLVVDNFVIGSQKIKARGNITQTGANRSLWVYPLGTALTIFFFLGPICFFPIRGGHAKLVPTKTYNVYIENQNNL